MPNSAHERFTHAVRQIAFFASLVAFSLAAQAQTVTWTGDASSDANWSTAHNWLGDNPPVDNVVVNFDGNSAQNLATVNDIPGLNLNGLKIVNPAGDVSIGGNGFTLYGAIDASAAMQNLAVDLDSGQSIALGSTQTWTVKSGQLVTINSPITGTAGTNLQFGSTTSQSGSSGSFWLSASNTFAGTAILGGPNITYFLVSSKPLGTGTLSFNSFNSPPILQSMGDGGRGGVTFNNPMTWQSGFVLGNATTGDLTMNGDIKFVGDIAGQTNRTINNMSAYFAIINGKLTLGDPDIVPSVHNRTLTLTNVIGSGTLIYGIVEDPTSATNSDIGSVTKNGTGFASLANPAITYSGSTNIQNGTLAVTFLADQGQPSSLGTGAAGATITLGSGTTTGALRYFGTEDVSTSRQLQLLGTSGGGLLENTGTGVVSFTSPTFGLPGAGSKTLTLKGTNTRANTVAGVIADRSASATTAVSKTEFGTWVLTGVNTYSGGTQVLFGTLRINNTSGSGTGAGAVTVSNGGILGGIGTVAGATSVNSGGAIAPGTPEADNGIGTFTFDNSITLASGAKLNFDLGAGGHDLIRIANDLILPASGSVTVNLANVGGLSGGPAITLVDYSRLLGGSFATLTLGTQPAGFTYTLINNTANTSIDLLVSAVPEPAASICTVLVLWLAIGLRWQRPIARKVR